MRTLHNWMLLNFKNWMEVFSNIFKNINCQDWFLNKENTQVEQGRNF